MKHFKNIIPFTVMLMLFFLMPFIILAQPPDPCPDPNFPDCPIDDGVVYLAVAVVAIAIKKAYDYKSTLKRV